MPMSHLALILSILALILTKGADIATTVRGIQRVGITGEKNPLARWAMERWGLAWGIMAIMGLWFLVVLVTYVPMWFAPAWMQWLTAGMGCFVACCQWDVARMNATGRHSWFTSLAQRGFVALKKQK